MTRNHRNGRARFDLYAPLCKGGSREFVQLSVLLKEARARSPAHGQHTEVDWHLTVRNRARVALNEEVNAYQARVYTERTGMNALYLQAPETAAARGLQQSCRVFPGITLVGCRTELGVKQRPVLRGVGRTRRQQHDAQAI